MNNVVLKELKKEHIMIKVILYGLLTLVGLELLHFSNIGFTNPIRYVPMIFYIFAFLSLIAYFGNRIKGNYELLFFGLINVITGTFVLVNVFYPNSGFILSDAVLLFSILNVLNSINTCLKLWEEKNVSAYMKVAITILLLFLGVFVVSALYDKVDFGTLILGYYFMAFGLFQLLDIFSLYLLSNKDYQKKILNYFNSTKKEKEEKQESKEEKEDKEKKKEKKSVKNRTIKKIKRK